MCPWYHLYLPFEKTASRGTIIPPALYRARPSLPTYVRFSKPLGKEFAVSASAASHQMAALFGKLADGY